jgi:purine-binding chemotaxis protein CheW
MMTETTVDRAAPLVVTCRIAGQRYALPISAVLQVVRLPQLTHLVGAPPEICGFLNLRGALLPVVSGRMLVDAPQEWSLDSHVVIVGDGVGRPALGLLVDAVDQVYRCAVDSFVPLNHGAAYISGALRSQGEQVLLFDPQLLAAVAQRQLPAPL